MIMHTGLTGVCLYKHDTGKADDCKVCKICVHQNYHVALSRIVLFVMVGGYAFRQSYRKHHSCT